MNEVQYVALSAELLAGHPATGAYNVDHQLAADAINLADIPRVKLTMTGREIRNATDLTEFDALTDGQQATWIAFTQLDAVLNPAVGGIDEQVVKSIFPGGATLAALNSLRNELVSQAAILKLGVVTAGQVEKVRLG